MAGEGHRAPFITGEACRGIASRKPREERQRGTRGGRERGSEEERRAREAELCEERRRETRLGFLIYASEKPAGRTHGTAAAKSGAAK